MGKRNGTQVGDPVKVCKTFEVVHCFVSNNIDYRELEPSGISQRWTTRHFESWLEAMLTRAS